MTSLFDTKLRTRVTPAGVMVADAAMAVTGCRVDREVVLGGSHRHNAGISTFAADTYALVRRGAG